MTKLGELIKKKRQSRNLSLREFADKCGLSHSYIKNLEEFDPRSGKAVVPTIDSVEKLASALEMSLEDLLRETGYIQGIGARFEPSNLRLIRGSRSYEEMAEEIYKKTRSKIDSAVYKLIEEGQDKSHTPIFLEILAEYAGVDRTFFYRKNTVETLELARQQGPYIIHDISKVFTHDKVVDEFINNPESVEYLKLAKELYEKRIKVSVVRDMLFDK